MTWSQRGRIEGGAIVLPTAVPLPEGTEVDVRVDVARPAKPEQGEQEPFATLPFFGMWADREDMQDGAAWVRGEREKWGRRFSRRD